MSAIEVQARIPAPPAIVFETLLDGEAFTGVTGAPATIDPTAGGEFRCFGGMIVGRQIELAEAKRIVQAWRPGNWPEGLYSLVRFDLADRDGETELTITQTGMPEEQREHLTTGWRERYLEPLAAHLAR